MQSVVHSHRTRTAVSPLYVCPAATTDGVGGARCREEFFTETEACEPRQHVEMCQLLVDRAKGRLWMAVRSEGRVT